MRISMIPDMYNGWNYILCVFETALDDDADDGYNGLRLCVLLR